VTSRGSPQEINLRWNVTKEGKYIVLISFCDATTSNVLLEGKAEVQNPYGYFPARLYGLIPFSYLLLAIYILFLLAWTLYCSAFWSQLLPVHRLITGLLVCLTLSTALRCVDNRSVNRVGSLSESLQFLTLLLDTLVGTLFRLLILLLAMGSESVSSPT